MNDSCHVDPLRKRGSALAGIRGVNSREGAHLFRRDESRDEEVDTAVDEWLGWCGVTSTSEKTRDIAENDYGITVSEARRHDVAHFPGWPLDDP
jgi:hypothetical protein